MQDDKTINPLKIYNAEEAAKVLGVNEQTLLDYLRAGKIAAQKIGEWKILGKSLEEFLMQNPMHVRITPESFKYPKEQQWTPRAEIVEDKQISLGEDINFLTWTWEKQKFDTKEQADKWADFQAKQLLLKRGIKSSQDEFPGNPTGRKGIAPYKSGAEETAKVFDKGSKLPVTENAKGEWIDIKE